MSDNYLNDQIDQDFDKAKGKAFFGHIFNILKPEKQELLSFYSVKELVKPRSETYLGMRVVKISDIVGSEGRYYDFNNTFLPRKEHLRNRWTNVDKAYYKEINLPPINLYKLGDVYFVRDGNHRVSVARAQGIESIDAEVVELSAQITVTKGMTEEDIRGEIVNYERKEMLEATNLDKIINMEGINFTAPGRYDEMLRHILGHKYFINLDREEEISFEEAALSWYNNLFAPINKLIEEHNILSRFPGRTNADIYIWIVKHWDKLKKKYGQHYPLEKAVVEYSSLYGLSKKEQLFKKFKKFFLRFFKISNTHSSDQ